ncbi:INO80 complex subunit E [Elysia marginata]|uniref:INO80 complex subunit E n=1 Tax=Elysia marginata TaxID=1093978 RepID=A0AAV4HQH7_9GAST|nr:INO80 complex subunit E [Elysia marginata]
MAVTGETGDGSEEFGEGHIDYKQKYKGLKKKLRFLVYEQECFLDELRKAQRKLLKVARDRSFLLDRLLQQEKIEDSSDESEATNSTDTEDVPHREAAPTKKQLTFRQHVGRIKQKAAKRINTLRCLAGKSWGSEKEDLQLVYLTYIKSAISYACNAWYLCVSKENHEKLEVTQRDAARTITGCTKNTNSKLLINEAGLLPLYVESDIVQATVYERCLRLPGDDPLREIAENPVRRRLKSLGTWRETGKSSAEDDGLEDLPRERLIPVPDIPPWMIPDTFSCSPSLTTSVSKTDPPEAQKAAVEETMKYLAKPDIEI